MARPRKDTPLGLMGSQWWGVGDYPLPALEAGVSNFPEIFEAVQWLAAWSRKAAPPPPRALLRQLGMAFDAALTAAVAGERMPQVQDDLLAHLGFRTDGKVKGAAVERLVEERRRAAQVGAVLDAMRSHANWDEATAITYVAEEYPHLMGEKSLARAMRAFRAAMARGPEGEPLSAAEQKQAECALIALHQATAGGC